jgi:hypothetical protein
MEVRTITLEAAEAANKILKPSSKNSKPRTLLHPLEHLALVAAE